MRSRLTAAAADRRRYRRPDLGDNMPDQTPLPADLVASLVAGVIKGRTYLSSPRINIPKLCGRGAATHHFIANALDLETVCGQGDKGAPLMIRTTWSSKTGYVFDEIHKYTLLCTKNTEGKNIGSGRSFTFLPQGKVVEK